MLLLIFLAYIGASYYFQNESNPEVYLIKMKNNNYNPISDIWELE